LKRDQQVDIATGVRFAACEGAEHFQSGDAVTLAERRKPGPNLVQRWRQNVVRRNHNQLSTYKHSARPRFAERKVDGQTAALRTSTAAFPFSRNNLQVEYISDGAASAGEARIRRVSRQ